MSKATATINKEDKFWYEDYTVLYQKDKFADFVPMSRHTYEQKLNAIARFGIYIGIILFAIKSNANYLVIPLIALGFTYFIYYFGHNKNHDDFIGEITQPTKDNPFMNVLIPEYAENPQRGPAADIQNEDIKKEVEKYFNENLYRDVDDIWERSNSQRQWITNPSTTIPNDRDAFMEWCYDTKKVCKDGDLDVCNRYVDLRAGHT
jgi:hypothetical protein